MLRKTGKLGGLLFMHMTAWPAVWIGIDWMEAYYFVGEKLLKKQKQISSQCQGEEKLLRRIKKIRDKMVLYLKKYTTREPDLENISCWVNANIRVFQNSLIEKYDTSIHQKVASTFSRVIQTHQLDKLDLEFLPRNIAVGSIGVYENIDIYIKAAALGLRPPKKLILLVDPKARINNPCYLRYWSQHITIISDPSLIQRLAPLEKVLTAPINFYMSFYEKTISSPFALGIVREKWYRENRKPTLTISNEDYRRGWDCLKSLGVSQDTWFVCLHVREAGWNDPNSYASQFRNADIKTYFSAIKAVVDAGGWVIRMGDPGMTPLPPMPHVIDYAHSQAKSDWMDVFLCSQCRFIIGSSSGVFPVASAFGVPAVVTNFLQASAVYQMSSQDILLPRICRDKTKNRNLTFYELISPPLGMAFSQIHYDELGIEAVENTPEQIKDAVMEMLERFHGTVQYSEEDEILQERFQKVTASCGKLYGNEDFICYSRIGRKFLRDHAALLPAEVMAECSS